MAAGIVILPIRDSAGAVRLVRFWSDDGTTAGNLSAVQVLDPIQAAAKTRVSIADVTGLAATPHVFRDADPASTWLEIGNPQDAPASLWISDAVDAEANNIDAGVGGDSFELLPGQFYTWPNGVAGRVSIFSPIAAHAYTGRKA